MQKVSNCAIRGSLCDNEATRQPVSLKGSRRNTSYMDVQDNVDLTENAEQLLSFLSFVNLKKITST